MRPRRPDDRSCRPPCRCRSGNSGVAADHPSTNLLVSWITAAQASCAAAAQCRAPLPPHAADDRHRLLRYGHRCRPSMFLGPMAITAKGRPAGRRSNPAFPVVLHAARFKVKRTAEPPCPEEDLPAVGPSSPTVSQYAFTVGRDHLCHPERHEDPPVADLAKVPNAVDATFSATRRRPAAPCAGTIRPETRT